MQASANVEHFGRMVRSEDHLAGAVLFAIAVSLGSGDYPFMRAARVDSIQALREGSRIDSKSLRYALVQSEVYANGKASLS
jgi:hypothetical protein